MSDNDFQASRKIRIIRLDKVNPDELIHLYRHAGWWEPAESEDPILIQRLIEGSLCCYGAMDSGRLVGFGRAISDGVADGYIQDVVVLDSHRKRGIATRIVQKILDDLSGRGISWIGLIATPGSMELYRRLGFSPLVGHTPMRFTGAPDHEN